MSTLLQQTIKQSIRFCVGSNWQSVLGGSIRRIGHTEAFEAYRAEDDKTVSFKTRQAAVAFIRSRIK